LHYVLCFANLQHTTNTGYRPTAQQPTTHKKPACGGTTPNFSPLLLLLNLEPLYVKLHYQTMMVSQKYPTLSCRTWSGIQNLLKSLDSGLRRNDALKEFQIFYEIVKFLFWSDWPFFLARGRAYMKLHQVKSEPQSRRILKDGIAALCLLNS
jgi:hypothetical protein